MLYYTGKPVPADDPIPTMWFKTIDTVIFDGKGGNYQSEMHGVTIIFPPGAIPVGETAEMKIGVTPVLPEIFESCIKHCTPVSPTVWLHMNVTIQKPIFVRIHHFAFLQTETHSEALAFAKMTSEGVQIVQDGNFPVGLSYGDIKLQHFCFLNVIRNMDPADIPANKYTILLMKQKTSFGDSWKCDIILIPSLSTFLQVQFACTLQSRVYIM